jgi:hypothetical protein
MAKVAQCLLLPCSSTSKEQIGIIGAKWSRALALLLHKEKWGLLKSLILEILGERF